MPATTLSYFSKNITRATSHRTRTCSSSTSTASQLSCAIEQTTPNCEKVDPAVFRGRNVNTVVTAQLPVKTEAVAVILNKAAARGHHLQRSYNRQGQNRLRRRNQLAVTGKTTTSRPRTTGSRAAGTLGTRKAARSRIFLSSTSVGTQKQKFVSDSINNWLSEQLVCYKWWLYSSSSSCDASSCRTLSSCFCSPRPGDRDQQHTASTTLLSPARTTKSHHLVLVTPYSSSSV
ncbi:unnamed protein product [Amoebophrya sp. A120]|nr:unnamed protein product [Amoebophrya sp. A120]|eukprot:GSA120T00007699001.1